MVSYRHRFPGVAVGADDDPGHAVDDAPGARSLNVGAEESGSWNVMGLSSTKSPAFTLCPAVAKTPVRVLPDPSGPLSPVALAAVFAFVAFAAFVAFVAFVALSACAALGTCPSVDSLIRVPVTEFSVSLPPGTDCDLICLPVRVWSFSLPAPIDCDLMFLPLIFDAAYPMPPAIANTSATEATIKAGEGSRRILLNI